jgi:D-alanyl-D-alanine dipeptidase
MVAPRMEFFALFRWRSFAICLLLAGSANGAEASRKAGARKDEPMVDVAQACPGVVIQLRYATPNNITNACIYSPDARCYVRQSVAQRLNRAQQWLSDQGVRLKIWDAYRPAWAQKILWQTIQNAEVIGDPLKGGSLHTWGACVDVTLVDKYGRELRMPTDFDDFSQDAASNYRGSDRLVARNLKLLQTAIGRAGFFRMRDEWWHFTAQDAIDFAPIDLPLTSAGAKAKTGGSIVQASKFKFRQRVVTLRSSASL